MSESEIVPNYVPLLKEITEIFNSSKIDSIDEAPVVYKYYFLNDLAGKISASHIVGGGYTDPAHMLIMSVWDLLYKKQGSFHNSYDRLLYLAFDSIKGKRSYIAEAKLCEKFLNKKIASLKVLAVSASKTENQQRLSAVLGQKIGIIRASVIAMLIALQSMDAEMKDKSNQAQIYIGRKPISENELLHLRYEYMHSGKGIFIPDELAYNDKFLLSIGGEICWQAETIDGSKFYKRCEDLTSNLTEKLKATQDLKIHSNNWIYNEFKCRSKILQNIGG